jgi:uncharacterized protein (DUF433 family)
MTVPTGYKYIVYNEDGKPIIEGTDKTVVELIAESRVHNWSPEDLQQQHPELNLAQIYSARAYHQDHAPQLEAEIDQQIRQIRQKIQQIRQEQIELKHRLHDQKARLHDQVERIAQLEKQITQNVSSSASSQPSMPFTDAWSVLKHYAGTIDGPADWSAELDHYLYGTQKDEQQNDDEPNVP